jgi:hypothetical protein
MSERAAREYLRGMWSLVGESGECNECFGFGYHKEDCPIAEILADEPDVVKILRFLVDWRDQYKTDVTGHQFALPDMFVTIMQATIYEIEKLFGVCLTDNGWEYTDERENDS